MARTQLEEKLEEITIRLKVGFVGGGARQAREISREVGGDVKPGQESKYEQSSSAEKSRIEQPRAEQPRAEQPRAQARTERKVAPI